MGIMNWFRKKNKDTVETAFEEAEVQNSDDGTTLHENPFHVMEEKGGCCSGSGYGSHEQESSEDSCGNGGCGSGGETKTTSSGCCSGESTSMLTHVTTQTTLREAGQNPLALEIMLKSGLPFGCGMKHLSIQEAGKSAGLGAPKIKKVVDEINQKIRNTGSKQIKKLSAPSAGGKTTGKKAGTKKGKK